MYLYIDWVGGVSYKKKETVKKKGCLAATLFGNPR
jgi:hypothetical protein